MASFAVLILLSCLIGGHGALASREIKNDSFVEKEIFNLVISGLRGQIDQMQRYVVNIGNSLSEQKELNSDLKEQVLELKNDKDVIKAKFSDLQKEANANEDRNLFLQRKVEFLTKKIILLSKSKQVTQPLWQNDNDNEHARDDSDTIQGKSNNRTKANSSTRQGYTKLKYTSKGSIELPHSIQARQITGSIAFSSYVKTDITGLNKGEVIKFDGLLVNDGNAYDVTTGIFTAPRDGLYLFSYFVEDYTDQDLWVYLRQDNYVRSQAVAEPYAEHQNIMGGNVVLLHCAAGSRIWIVIDIGTRVQGNLSTFSGIFLH